MKILGREPALWLALLTAIVSTVSAFVVHVSDNQQTLIGATAAAVVGLLTAWSVARDKLVPAILGFMQTVLALAVGFGLHLDGDRQAILMSLVSTIVAVLFVRPAVTARVTSDPLAAPRYVPRL